MSSTVIRWADRDSRSAIAGFGPVTEPSATVMGVYQVHNETITARGQYFHPPKRV
jgi:hypothetical protein